MKTRESGMPEERQWESFFAPAQVLRLLGLDDACRNVLDIGCGYGTFTIPAAQKVHLHAEDPVTILREAWRVLRPGGRLGIMHWRCDAATPRGPSMSIRPQPDQCRAWAADVGFISASTSPVALPPYHYGWRLWRPEHKEHA